MSPGVIGVGLRALVHICWEIQALQVVTQLTGKTTTDRKLTKGAMYMKKISNQIKKMVLTTAFSMLAVSMPFHIVYAAPGGAMEPAVSTGITILPLDQQPVPDVLKNQARLELTQMKNHGYVDATEDAVSSLDKAKEDKDKLLKTMAEVMPKLKVNPANLGSSVLGQAVLLGASASGGHTEEGWTGLSRIFVVPKLGLIGLYEVDFIASQGGVAFIKEAINQDINGSPAILSVKQSQSKKGLTELTWATDQKIYTLSVNRALKSQQSIDEFLALARSIF